uniref:Uncharacterized protein n=1 Tax=Meloidogyne javanica TaxID=6303 RepID=A0A915LCH7_MELJA
MTAWGFDTHIRSSDQSLAKRKNDGKILYFLETQKYNLEYLIKISSYGVKPEESLAQKFYKFMKKRELSFDDQIKKFIDKVKREDGGNEESEEVNEGKNEVKEGENKGKNELREEEEVQEEDEERKKENKGKEENAVKKKGENAVKNGKEKQHEEEKDEEDYEEDDEEIDDQGDEDDEKKDKNEDEENEDEVKEESEEEHQEEDLSYPYTIQELELKNDCLIMLYKEKYIIKKLIFEEFKQKGTVDFTKMFGKKKPKTNRAKSAENPMKKTEPEKERQNSMLSVFATNVYSSAANLKSRFSSFLPFH